MDDLEAARTAAAMVSHMAAGDRAASEQLLGPSMVDGAVDAAIVGGLLAIAQALLEELAKRVGISPAEIMESCLTQLVRQEPP